MKEVFADSFYWLAVLNTNDVHHEQAMHIELTGRLVTSQAVQIEVMDALCQREVRALAGCFWDETNQDPDLLVVPLDPELLTRAATLFQSRDDKDWSLTDCISFVIMSERVITD